MIAVTVLLLIMNPTELCNELCSFHYQKKNYDDDHLLLNFKIHFSELFLCAHRGNAYIHYPR